MNRLSSIILAAAALLAACTSAPGPEPHDGTLREQPHLEKRGNVTQLIVEGEPFLVLASELRNSSASSPAYMEPLWENLKAGGMNTVLAVVPWEQVEPVEGEYDFSAVDALLAAANKHGLKLALLWFGSWKNGMSSYHPTWVKTNDAKYPLAETKEGIVVRFADVIAYLNHDIDDAIRAGILAESDLPEDIQKLYEYIRNGHAGNKLTKRISAAVAKAPAAISTLSKPATRINNNPAKGPKERAKRPNQAAA